MPVVTLRPIVWLMMFAVAIFAQYGAGKLSSAEKPHAVVYVAPIEGIIDLGLAPFVQRVLKEAANANASAVILEINTFGGRVDAAVLIRDALFERAAFTL